MADQAVDNGAEAPVETLEARLKAFGFTNSMGLWREPNGERVFNTEDAIAALESGEIKPFEIPWPDAGAAGVAEHARILEERIREAEAARDRPPEPPPWLVAQAEFIAAKTVEKMKPLIRAEVRAALKAEARKQARKVSE